MQGSLGGCLTLPLALPSATNPALHLLGEVRLCHPGPQAGTARTCARELGGQRGHQVRGRQAGLQSPELPWPHGFPPVTSPSLSSRVKPGLRGASEVPCLSPAAPGEGVLALLRAEIFLSAKRHPFIYAHFHRYFLSPDHVLGTVRGMKRRGHTRKQHRQKVPELAV